MYSVDTWWADQEAGRTFEGEEAVVQVIERIVAPLGLRADESTPYADARHPDGCGCRADVLETPYLVPACLIYSDGSLTRGELRRQDPVALSLRR